ncbi:hypothetical protein IJL65_03920 [bacterium]|nr:hypothetical protein [bacterium]
MLKRLTSFGVSFFSNPPPLRGSPPQIPSAKAVSQIPLNLPLSRETYKIFNLFKGKIGGKISRPS